MRECFLITRKKPTQFAVSEWSMHSRRHSTVNLLTTNLRAKKLYYLFFHVCNHLKAAVTASAGFVALPIPNPAAPLKFPTTTKAL